jgi:hypothetical protein
MSHSTSTATLRVEKALARAHLALWQAANWSESFADQGISDDLYMLAAEAGRINVDLLKVRPPRKPAPSNRTYP